MEGGWEGKKVGTEGGGMMRSEKLECTQKLPQTQHIWHLGTLLGDHRPVSYTFRKLFVVSNNISIRR